MVQIFLVRHGQANSDAKDEISYDKLSPLGKLQAGWLGQYFKKNEFSFDSCFSGTCLLYTSPSPRDGLLSRMPSSA